MFSLVTFLAFNSFFIYGGRPEILRMAIPLQFLFNAVVMLVSSIWLCRTWGRSSQQYQIEGSSNSYRDELKSLPLNVEQFLDGRTINKLTSEEVIILASVLPEYTQKNKSQVYKAILEDIFIKKKVPPKKGLEIIAQPVGRVAIEA